MKHSAPLPADAGAGGVPGLARLLTPQEIGEAWQLDPSTVRRLFADTPGVLRLKFQRQGKRAYYTIRIPVAVYQRVLAERSR